LDAKDFKPIAKRISDLSKGEGGAKRVDRLSTICTRLYLHLSAAGYKSETHHAENLVTFLLLEDLPNDLRFSLHRDLITISEEIANMLRDPKLAKLVIAGL
jgi:hypothetical protein